MLTFSLIYLHTCRCSPKCSYPREYQENIYHRYTEFRSYRKAIIKCYSIIRYTNNYTRIISYCYCELLLGERDLLTTGMKEIELSKIHVRKEDKCPDKYEFQNKEVL